MYLNPKWHITDCCFNTFNATICHTFLSRLLLPMPSLHSVCLVATVLNIRMFCSKLKLKRNIQTNLMRKNTHTHTHVHHFKACFCRDSHSNIWKSKNVSLTFDATIPSIVMSIFFLLLFFRFYFLMLWPKCRNCRSSLNEFIRFSFFALELCCSLALSLGALGPNTIVFVHFSPFTQQMLFGCCTLGMVRVCVSEHTYFYHCFTLLEHASLMNLFLLL